MQDWRQGIAIVWKRTGFKPFLCLKSAETFTTEYPTVVSSCEPTSELSFSSTLALTSLRLGWNQLVNPYYKVGHRPTSLTSCFSHLIHLSLRRLSYLFFLRLSFLLCLFLVLVRYRPPGEANPAPFHYCRCFSRLFSTGRTMPKAVRSTSQGQYRNNPIAIASRSIAPSNTSDLYYPIAPTMQSHMPSMSLPSLMGGPVQYPRNMSQDMVYEQSIQQNPAQLPSPAVQPLPVRASSGAWTPQDDQVLMTARSAGQNWAPIQATYFPNKTPNACRKRHERLMDRRNSDEWDIVKLEVMAKEYMSIRKDMWTMLAERTGEKWTVLEQKVCVFI